MNFPFKENKINSQLLVREFDQYINFDELVWHRDREDRKVSIIQSDGWQFQFDNELPIDLHKGDELFIKANDWHRVLPGDGKLIVAINIL
jgi:hypothetical protein